MVPGIPRNLLIPWFLPRPGPWSSLSSRPPASSRRLRASGHTRQYEPHAAVAPASDKLS